MKICKLNIFSNSSQKLKKGFILFGLSTCMFSLGYGFSNFQHNSSENSKQENNLDEAMLENIIDDATIKTIINDTLSIYTQKYEELLSDISELQEEKNSLTKLNNRNNRNFEIDNLSLCAIFDETRQKKELYICEVSNYGIGQSYDYTFKVWYELHSYGETHYLDQCANYSHIYDGDAAPLAQYLTEEEYQNVVNNNEKIN